MTVLLATLAGLAATSVAFLIGATLIRPSRERIIATLIGGQCAALLEIPIDVVASRLDFWHYLGYQSHGPLAYYPVAGIGYALLALVAWRLSRSRFGWRGVGVLFLVLGLFGPFRDRRVGQVTGLFELSTGLLPSVLDAVFIWLVPTALAITTMRFAMSKRSKSLVTKEP